MKFDLRRLQLLRELARRGTISSVADALSYSTSAVSQQLSVLEREIGTQLLVPDGRRVRLTPQAEILIQHTAAVLRQLERAEAEIVPRRQRSWVPYGSPPCRPSHCRASRRCSALCRRPTQDCRSGCPRPEPDIAIPGLMAREYDLVCDELFPDSPVARWPGGPVPRHTP